MSERLPERQKIVEWTIWRDGEVAQETHDIITLKQRIFEELENPGFPDLEFLFSDEALAVMKDVWDQLLADARAGFQEVLSLEDKYITPRILFSRSRISYFHMLLRTLKELENNDLIRDILEDFKAKYVEYTNEIQYSRRYYEMLQIALMKEDITPEEKRAVEVSIEEYQKRGINVDEWERQRLQEINIELARLADIYSNNLADEESEVQIFILDEEVLAEMPQDIKDNAQDNNSGRQSYTFGVNQIPDILKYCSDRDIREQAHRLLISLAWKWEKSNRGIVIEMLTLREERAKILWYSSHNAYAMGTKMSDSLEEVQEVLENMYSKARAVTEADIQEMKQHFGLENFEVWDYPYYRRKYDEHCNNFDISTVKPYFEIEGVITGMFKIVEKLFGLQLQEVDAPVYGEGNVYEVYKAWKSLGYLWCDFYERDKKQTWAWAEPIRAWASFNENWNIQKRKKIVINASNITRKSWGCTLLDFYDVETLFHEFGHALHEICYEGDFASLSGLRTEDDFAELPSQLLENWCRHPEGIAYIARHHETWEKLPDEIIEKILTSHSFKPAYSVVRTLMLTFYDLALHWENVPKTSQEFDAFSLNILRERSLFPISEDNSLYANFDHLFYDADSMYAAWYFSYIWSEIIEQDVWKVFLDAGDVFDTAIAQRFYDTILSRGFLKPGSQLFRDFMWRDIDIEAFMKSKGLI